MTFNQLLNAVPLTFKCVGLSDHYEFWCKQCSFKRYPLVQKKLVRISEWQSNWQLRLSEELEKHQLWHEQNPNKSWDEFNKEQLQHASDEAMRTLNSYFSKMFRK